MFIDTISFLYCLSIVQNFNFLKNASFHKSALFPSSVKEEPKLVVPLDRATLCLCVTQWLKGNLFLLHPCQFTDIFPAKSPSQRHRLGFKYLSSITVLTSFYVCIALSLSFPCFIWFISPFSFVVFAFLQYLFSFFLVTFIHSSLLKEAAVFFYKKKISRLHRISVTRCTVYSGSVI